MKTRTDQGITYSAEERAEMLRKMKQGAAAFYRQAVYVGYHQFVELAGFMNETIKACEAMDARGEDFGTQPLKLSEHHARYIGEKLGCIFGVALLDDATFEQFVEGLRHG